ncbi:MAG: putative multidrug resistance ABC transporter ATP-binding/permease protein YheI [Bryobacteraceae bacterium]|nr:putative multidrug resistance ABC transporter ATP-binding/permease protein YheI [Bryobacteraceae bacterium]
MIDAARKLWPYLWRHRRGLTLGFGALIVKDLFVVGQPILIKMGIDSLMGGFSLRIVVYLALGLILLSALKGVFQYWMRITLVGISRDVEFDLRNDLYAHLLTLSPDFFTRYRTGDILSRSTSDLNAVRMMLGPGVMYWAETMFTFLLALVVMLSVDWRLTLVALSPAPLVSIAVVFFGQRIHARFEQIQRQFAEISSRVQENLAGMRMVRAYVQEDAELALFDSLNKDYVDQNIRLARISGLFMPLLQFLIGITFLLVLWAGGYALLEKRITLGGFVMFNTYMGMLIWPMIAFGWVINLIQRGMASFARIDDMIHQKPRIAAPREPLRLEEPVRGEVEFQDVVLEGASGMALGGISLRIKAGQTVAIAGHTGCGKTSLVRMIPRMADPDSGAVLLDGVDVRRFDPRELRSHIGFVPQETFLFSCTVAENIALGVPSATREQIEEAAAIAGLGPDLASFANGLDTVVGERGITLSGGQKQRAAIARAILRNPRVLILDDALSSVDTVTEERILSGLSRVLKGRTTILISHRVSTIRQADVIYVLDHGKIVEQGTHEQLLARGGYYAGLHEKQLLEEELEAI